jgi:hypothetical protein
MTQHLPVDYRPEGESRHAPPAEVCNTCTDWERKLLVPSSFCPIAKQHSDQLYEWMLGLGPRPDWADEAWEQEKPGPTAGGCSAL